MQAFGRLCSGLMRFAHYSLSGWSGIFVIREIGRLCIAGWQYLIGQHVLNVVLIRPSKYDHETGFVQQDWRGVLPSNTLATLYQLVQDVQRHRRLGVRTRIIIRAYDESVQVVRPSRITMLCRLIPSTSVVMLVGVQSNQFARASDLALDFRKRGLTTIVGGYHVSGVVAQFPQDGDPVNERAFHELGLERLLNRGVSLFAGEAEGQMLGLLQDVLNGELKPVYNRLSAPPDLENEPVPMPIMALQRLFATQGGTIDACRGCPFHCKFCTIRIVQGQDVRARGVQCFIDAMRASWNKGIRSFFFTSDNAARDPLWRERFEALVALKQQEGVSFNITIQVDTKCHKIPGFVELAARAGVTYAFIGLESMNPKNLPAIGKEHNNVSQYRDLVAVMRKHGIAVHFGYMIGLPFDTSASVTGDVAELLRLDPDLVSFFNATPLPGADDHREMFTAGIHMDPDLNNYDSFDHPVCKHLLMSLNEWQAAYRNAWETFYSPEHIIAILRRTPRELYWKRFWSLVWYRHSIDVTRRHPMVSGFFRKRDRLSRRPTFPVMSWWTFQKFNWQESIRTWQAVACLLQLFCEIWLQTRSRSQFEQRMIELADRRCDGNWSRLKLADLREVYRTLGAVAPNWVILAWQRVSGRSTRQDLVEHWRSVKRKLQHGNVWALFSRKTVSCACSDTMVFLRFVNGILRADRRMEPE